MASRTLPSPFILTVASRLYALLLGLYPSQFRADYGAHMAQVFRDCCRQAYQQHGLLGIVPVWVSAFSDLVVTAIEQHLAPHGGPGAVMAKAGIGLAAGLAGGALAGLGARLAMRGVSLAAGLAPGFSLEGTVAIVTLGLVVGTPFGLVFMLARSFIPGEGLWKGLAYGLLLFVIFIAPPFLFYREGEALLASPWVTLALFAPVVVGYGIVVQAAVQRLERQQFVKVTSSPLWAQLAWLAVFAFLLELAVLGTTSIQFHVPRLPPVITDQARNLSLPFALVRDANNGLALIIALGYFGFSTYMFWGRNRSPMARFAAMSLLLFGGAFFNTGAGYYAPITHNVALLKSAFHLLQVVGVTCLLGLLYIFPNGRFATSWARLLALAWLIWAVAWAALPNLWPEATTLIVLSLFLMSGVVAQVQRYRQTASVQERQQLRGVVIGFMIAIAGFALVTVTLLLIPGLRLPNVSGLSVTASVSLYMLPWLCIPAALAWAMQRHRLWAQ